MECVGDYHFVVIEDFEWWSEVIRARATLGRSICKLFVRCYEVKKFKGRQIR